MFTCDDCPQGKWDLRVMPDEIDIKITKDAIDDVSVSGEERDKFPDEQNQDHLNAKRESPNDQHRTRKRSSLQYEIPDGHIFEKDKTASPEKRGSLQHEPIKHQQTDTEKEIQRQRSKSVPHTEIDNLEHTDITVHRKRKRSSLQYDNPDELYILGKINPAFVSSEKGNVQL